MSIRLIYRPFNSAETYLKSGTSSPKTVSVIIRIIIILYFIRCVIIICIINADNIILIICISKHIIIIIIIVKLNRPLADERDDRLSFAYLPMLLTIRLKIIIPRTHLNVITRGLNWNKIKKIIDTLDVFFFFHENNTF